MFVSLFVLPGCALLKDLFHFEKEVVEEKEVVIPHDPVKAKRHYNAGTKLVTQGDTEGAEREFSKAILFDKENITYYYDHAVACTTIDPASSKAEESFRKVLELAGNKKGSIKEVYYSYYGLAAIYASRGDKGLAVANLKKSVRSGFTHYNMLKNDSDFYSLRGDKEFDAFIKTLN